MKMKFCYFVSFPEWDGRESSEAAGGGPNQYDTVANKKETTLECCSRGVFFKNHPTLDLNGTGNKSCWEVDRSSRTSEEHIWSREKGGRLEKEWEKKIARSSHRDTREKTVLCASRLQSNGARQQQSGSTVHYAQRGAPAAAQHPTTRSVREIWWLFSALQNRVYRFDDSFVRLPNDKSSRGNFESAPLRHSFPTALSLFQAKLLDNLLRFERHHFLFNVNVKQKEKQNNKNNSAVCRTIS